MACIDLMECFSDVFDFIGVNRRSSAVNVSGFDMDLDKNN